MQGQKEKDMSIQSIAYKAEMLAKLEQMKVDKSKEKPLKLGTKVVAVSAKRIRSDIQAMVDEYIEMDAEMKKLQAQLKKMREPIEQYMNDRGLTVIPGSDRGSISLQPRDMAIVNARYTSYDLDGIVPLLDMKARKECIVKVVDKEVLDLLVKTGKAPKEVENFKLTKPTIAFTINHK